MKTKALLALGLSLAATSAFAASFTAGNVVLLQQSGTAATGNSGYLHEFSPSGAVVQSILLPDTTGSGIVFGGASSSVLAHHMSRSGDGAFLVIPGYGNYTTGGADVEKALGAVSPRVVAFVKYDGTFSRLTPSLNTVLEGIITRGAGADGWGNAWVVGATRVVWMNGSLTNNTVTARDGQVVDGKLYYTAGSGIYVFDSGLPFLESETASTVALASQMGTGNDPDGFAIPPAGGTIAYMSNYRGINGVGRYDWNGYAWAFSYVITNSYNEALPSIAVDFSQSPPVIYGVGAGLNKLYKFTDPGAAGTVTPTILSNAASGRFRAVAMAPAEPACPVFTTHPANITNDYGSTVTFTNVAVGAQPNAFNWTRYGTNLLDGWTGLPNASSYVTGAHSNILSVAFIGGADQTWYRAVAHNNGPCAATSDPAFLGLRGSCIQPPLTPRTIIQDNNAQFAAAIGSCLAPLTISWTWNDQPLSDGTGPSGLSTVTGSTTGTLSINNAQAGDSGTYKVTVIDRNGDPSVSITTLTVVFQPYFTLYPAPQDVLAGQTACFTVAAEGNGLTYYWYKDTVLLTNGPSGTGSTWTGAQTANLCINSVSAADMGTYTCMVSNLAGTATSDGATLTVGSPPAITAPPVSLIATAGVTATLSATVTGTGPITYSWKHNTDTLYDDGKHAGTSTATLTINDVQAGDAQTYTLTAANAYGTASASAVLRFVLAPPQPSGIPGLVIYEPFNYPIAAYIMNTNVNSWQDIISTWNQVTGQPAWWERLGNGSSAVRGSGIPIWPGIDCNNTTEWYWSSAPNNNHLKFGGINQSNGAVYFSFVFNAGQGAQMDHSSSIDRYDTIAGLTAGEGAENADNWVYRLCTHVCGTPGCNTFQLGLFKSGGSPNASSVHGAWVPVDLYNGAWNPAPGVGTHFIVGCYKFNSGTNLVNGSITNDDVISLWLDPPVSSFGAAEGSLPTPSAGGMITNWGVNAPITEFAMKGTLPPASRTMCSLRIGTTWASVTHPYYPTIQSTWDGTNLDMAWLAKDTAPVSTPGTVTYGYLLYESTDLNAWVLSALPVTQVGSQSATTTTASGTRFFRLGYSARSN